MSERGRYFVYNGWVGIDTAGCTCHGGGPHGHEPACGFEPLIKVEAVMPAVRQQILKDLDAAIEEFKEDTYQQIEFKPSQYIDFLRGVEAAKHFIMEGGSLWRTFTIQNHPLMTVFPHLKETDREHS